MPGAGKLVCEELGGGVGEVALPLGEVEDGMLALLLRLEPKPKFLRRELISVERAKA